jgi:hypothetical protein
MSIYIALLFPNHLWYTQGATQKFPKFERCVQTARSTVMSRQVSEALSFENQSAKWHRAVCYVKAACFYALKF